MFGKRPSRILDRAGYARAIDDFHAGEKRELLERFDHGAKTHGELDLTARDWIQEAHEEELDRRAYVIFDIELERRGL